MKRRPLLIALGSAAPVALCAGALWTWRRAPRTPASDEAGAAAVDYLFSLSLDDADGVHRTLSSWRGKTLVVNFWATWCAPCVEEMPQLQKLADQMHNANVQYLVRK